MTAFRTALRAAFFLAGVHAAASAEPVFAATAPSVMTGRATTSPSHTARCEVWQRELGFAGTIAAHDHLAFAEFLHPHAAFGVSGQPTIGREAILKAWQAILRGTGLKLAWYPDVVTVGGDGNIAYSSGPTLYQDLKSGAFRHGRYASVWQRDSLGIWQVVFDDGTTPQPADAAEVAAFAAGRRSTCPSL